MAGDIVLRYTTKKDLEAALNAKHASGDIDDRAYRDLALITIPRMEKHGWYDVSSRRVKDTVTGMIVQLGHADNGSGLQQLVLRPRRRSFAPTWDRSASCDGFQRTGEDNGGGIPLHDFHCNDSHESEHEFVALPELVDDTTDWEEDGEQWQETETPDTRSLRGGAPRLVFAVCIRCSGMVLIERQTADASSKPSTNNVMRKPFMLMICASCDNKRGSQFPRTEQCIAAFISALLSIIRVACLVAGRDVSLLEASSQMVYMTRDDVRRCGSKGDTMQSLDVGQLDSGDLNKMILPCLEMGFF